MFRRRKGTGKKIFFVFLLLIIAGGGWFAWSLGPRAGEARELVIAEGMGAGEIADYLFNEGLARSRLGFNVYVVLTGARGRLKAGSFMIPARADVPEMVGILTEGAGVEERTVRMIEGWTLQEMDGYLARENVWKQKEFLSAASAVRGKCAIAAEACRVVSEIPPKVSSLEGYLFPDTYRMYADAAPEDLIEKMLVRFGEKTVEKEFAETLQDSEYTLHELVTMASLIEAEVPRTEDRTVVAGLLWKRIGAGMPLQVDATINYITGKHERSASRADLKINSPYNTYLYPDLPPGPINNPGMGALRAAASPKESPYWFYLSAEDGTTIFSKTFDEHKVAKEKYLK